MNFLFLLISFDLDNVFTLVCNREFVAGSVIQATGMVKFEDGLRMGESLEAAGALVVAAPILESISTPPGGAGWSWVGYGCQKDPISDQIPTCLISHWWY